MIYRIGNHKVRHGDVQDQEGIKELIGDVRCDIFYTDPPWGAGNIKYWHTMNKKQNGIEYDTGEVDVGSFLHLILGLAKQYSKQWVVIEYGKRWERHLLDIAVKEGLIYCGKAVTFYSADNRELFVFFFNVNRKVEIDTSIVRYTKGFKTVNNAFKLLNPYEGSVGMDLCCGMGYTAQACINNKMFFIGNELNQFRLNKTIERLESGKVRKG